MIEYRTASVSEIIGLRHAVLREGKPLETAHFDRDTDAGTFHFGAFQSNQPVCCFTLMPSSWENETAWQLRGMATAASVRKQGVARNLLDYALSLPSTYRYASLIWCNARKLAIPFYQKTGWEVQSDYFDVPGIGPHVKMTKEIPLNLPHNVAL